MPTDYSDGAEVYREAYFRGLRPDPDVWIDQWADEYMRIRVTPAPPSRASTAPRVHRMPVSRCVVYRRLTPASV